MTRPLQSPPLNTASRHPPTPPCEPPVKLQYAPLTDGHSSPRAAASSIGSSPSSNSSHCTPQYGPADTTLSTQSVSAQATTTHLPQESTPHPLNQQPQGSSPVTRLSFTHTTSQADQFSPDTPKNTGLPSPTEEASPTTVSPSVQTPVVSKPPETGGLLSRSYQVLPPRPKPGRKPATDTPLTKRKEQNREAQRAFRERRANRVSEMETQIQALKQEWAQKEQDLRRQLHEAQWAVNEAKNEMRAKAKEAEFATWNDKQALNALNDQLEMLKLQNSTAENEKAALNQRVAELEASVHRFSSSSISSFPSRGSGSVDSQAVSPTTQELYGSRGSFYKTNMPPVMNHEGSPALQSPDSHTSQDQQNQARSQQTYGAINDTDMSEAMEIDFTSQFSRRPNNNFVVAQTAGQVPQPETSVDSGQGQLSSCGFCTSDHNCICRQMESDGALPSLNVSQEAMQSLPDMDSSALTLPPLHAAQPNQHVPGSCARCQTDPERRRICQMMAGASPPSQASQPRGDSTSDQGPRGAKRPYGSIDERATMSCAEAYDRLSSDPDWEQKRQDTSWMRRLKIHPTSSEGPSDANSSARCTAYEVEAASILTALSQGPSKAQFDSAENGQAAQTQAQL